MKQSETGAGSGLYSIRQAAKLLRLRPSVLKYWIGQRGELHPVVLPEFTDDSILSFAQLMELHFVKMFRDEGVSFQYIRKAAKNASQQFKAQYPFTVKRFDTDGRSIFATMKSKETDKTIVQDLEKGQLVFQTIIRPFFKKLDYSRSNEVERFWPLKQKGRVVLDPQRRFGQPIDSETGVPTRALIDAVTAGDGQDAKTVAKWFDVPLEAVKAAIRFEKSLAT